jgi:hypothetical protein
MSQVAQRTHFEAFFLGERSESPRRDRRSYSSSPVSSPSPLMQMALTNARAGFGENVTPVDFDMLRKVS